MDLETEGFRDRREAGRKLAESLRPYERDHPLILGLARGGLVVANEIATALSASLDVFVARKLGAPQLPELGIGAVAPGAVVVVDQRLAEKLGISSADLDRIKQRELEEVDRRLELYRGTKDPMGIEGRTVILVDDGLATGVTAIAAARSVRAARPKKLILAVPVCSDNGARSLRDEVDEVVCHITPSMMYAVGAWYREFQQTSDEEVMAILQRHREEYRDAEAS